MTLVPQIGSPQFIDVVTHPQTGQRQGRLFHSTRARRAQVVGSPVKVARCVRPLSPCHACSPIRIALVSCRTSVRSALARCCIPRRLMRFAQSPTHIGTRAAAPPRWLLLEALDIIHPKLRSQCAIANRNTLTYLL